MVRFFVLIVSTAAAFSLSPGGGSEVAVWDDVLPNEEHRAALHAYAAKSGLEHKCFSRPLPLPAADNAGEDNNIIERTLDAILTEIEGGMNSKQYVEYWTRQEWRHIEAHADVDENLSKLEDRKPPNENDDDSQSKFPTTYQSNNGHRYPIHGHVLYLQVGSDVKGPTCVFPKRSSGGDLLRSRSVQDQNSDEKCKSEGSEDSKRVKMVTVPAVPGRLLRFDGRDLHAVPRPHDLWMLPFVKGAAEYEPEDIWGRSVILFNIWPADEEPPLDVPLDRKEEVMKGSQTIDAFCNSFSNWKEVISGQKEQASSTTEPEQNQSVKVWLLGNERRREHPLRTVPLLAPAEGGRQVVREALAEKSKVTELWLRQQ